MQPLDVDSVREALGLGEPYAHWLAVLAAYGPEARAPRPPTDDAYGPEARAPRPPTDDAYGPEARAPRSPTDDAYGPEARAPRSPTDDAYGPDARAPRPPTDDAYGPEARAPRSPTDDASSALLRRLHVAEADVAEVLATRPSPEADPAWWWLLTHSYHVMVRHMGDTACELTWPPLPARLGARGRLFLVHLFLLVFDDVRAWHQAHAVPESASWGSFSGLGRAMAIYRQLHGESGVFEHGWMTLPFRACLYELGRLQYTPFRLGPDDGGPDHWYDTETCARLGPGFLPGDPTVGIHIPASGPMTPEGVDASLRWAAALFSQPQPFGPCRIAICGSWLLDEQWAEYLPSSSHIVQFQRRFTLLPGAGNADSSMFSHVLRRPPTDDLDALPQRTTLERAIVRHWRQGRHWQSRTGWLRL